VRFEEPGEDKEPRLVIPNPGDYVRITHRQTGTIGARFISPGARAFSRKRQTPPIFSLG
jgi:hypothetical protein